MKKHSGKTHECKTESRGGDRYSRHISESEVSGDSYRQIFNAVNDSIIVFNKDTGAILDINRKMIEEFGFSPEEIRSLDVGALSLNESPYSQVEAMEWIRRATEEGPQLFEWRSRDKNGRIFWTEVNLKLAVIEGEHRVLAIVREITERKQAEIALRESEQKLRRLYDSMTDAYASLDLSGRILDFNEAFRKMVGYSEEELHNLTFYDVTPPKWHEIEDRIIKEQVLKRGDSDLFEKEYIRKDGTVFPVELRTYLMRDDEGNPVGVWAIVRDITERKQAEDALRESEQKLRRLYDSMTDAYASMDLSGNVLEFNDAMVKMLGYSEEELHHYTYRDVTAPKWHEVEDRIIREQVLVRGDSDLFEKEYIRKDGTIFPVELRLYLMRDDEGNPIGMWAIVRDITERKRAEIALKDSERRLADIINFLPDATFAIDNEGKIIAWNHATEEMTGVKAADMIGKGNDEYSVAFYGYKRAMLLNLVSKPIEEIREIYEDIRTEGETLVAETYTPILRPGGMYAWFRSTPLYDTEGNVIGAIESVRDVTDRKLAEEYKREFYRRTIMAATDGKLLITERDEILKTAGQSILEFEIKSSEDLGNIRAEVKIIAHEYGMDDSAVHDFSVAIGEASTNALKHAGGGLGSIHKEDDSIMFVVADHGPGIEAMTIPQVAFVKGYTTAGTLGMGYKIMISLSDHVYIATSNKGTTVGIQIKLHSELEKEKTKEDFDWTKIHI